MLYEQNESFHSSQFWRWKGWFYGQFISYLRTSHWQKRVGVAEITCQDGVKRVYTLELLSLQGELAGFSISSFRGQHLQWPPPTHLKRPATSPLKPWLSIPRPLGHTLESYPLPSTFSGLALPWGSLCHISLVSSYAAAGLRPTMISPEKPFVTTAYMRSFVAQPAHSLRILSHGCII